jgi:hypothetical protein
VPRQSPTLRRLSCRTQPNNPNLEVRDPARQRRVPRGAGGSGGCHGRRSGRPCPAPPQHEIRIRVHDRATPSRPAKRASDGCQTRSVWCRCASRLQARETGARYFGRPFHELEYAERIALSADRAHQTLRVPQLSRARAAGIELQAHTRPTRAMESRVPGAMADARVGHASRRHNTQVTISARAGDTATPAKQGKISTTRKSSKPLQNKHSRAAPHIITRAQVTNCARACDASRDK